MTELRVSGGFSVDAGKTIQISAQAVYSDRSMRDVTSQASWSSDHPGIATVDSAGVVTGLVGGRALIAASFAGQTGGWDLLVQGPLIHYLVELQQLQCIGDCEDFTQGAGDFSYEVVLESPSVAIVTLAGTAGYPDPGVVVKLGTGQSYILSAPKEFYVRDQDGYYMDLTFNATEWDKLLTGDAPDSRMDRRHATASYAYKGQGNWIPEGANYITLGSSDACRIRLYYRIVKLAT